MMKKYFIISICILFLSGLKAQEVRYTLDSNKTMILLNDIKQIEKSNYDSAFAFIFKHIKQIKESELFSGDKSIFDSLIFIPVYNVQLKTYRDNKENKSLIDYKYYVELVKYKPINRILIFNNNMISIGTMYLLKDYFQTDYSYICYNFPGNKPLLFCGYVCNDIGYSKKNISFVKKQKIYNLSPIYLNINNFSEELFYLNNSTLMVLTSKNKVLNTDCYFRKKYNEKELIDKTQDTLLKYVIHGCLKDTNRMGADYSYYSYLDSIKGNPKQIIEEDYGVWKNLTKYKHSELTGQKYVTFYNKDNLIEKSYCYHNGIKWIEETRNYDNKKNKISEINIRLRQDSYFYDSITGKSPGHRTLNIDSLKYDTTFSYYELKYDSLGRIALIKENYKSNPYESTCLKKDYKYSMNIDTITYTIFWISKETINEPNNRIVEIYDSLHRKIGIQYFDIKSTKDSLTCITIFKYDKFSNLIGFYNQFPDKITGKLTEPYGQRYYLLYDKYGNWIKKYRIYGKKKYPLARRKIFY